MRQVLNGLMEDVFDLHRVPCTFEKNLLKTLSDEELLSLMGHFHDQILAMFGGFRYSPPTLPEPHKGKFFLKGLLDKISVSTGSGERVLEKYPDLSAVRTVYQAACLLSKFGSATITPEMSDAALDAYVRIEADLANQQCDWESKPLLVRARAIIGDLMSYDMDWLLFEGRHGPGAVAEKATSPGSKYDWVVPPGRTPHDFDECTGYAQCANFRSRLGFSHDQSRVCLVPKSWNKCRIICAEPAFRQYLQQSWSRRFDAIFTRARKDGWCTIDLHDQSQNAVVAMQASGHKYFGTLDLSSASDRLSLSLVKFLFGGHYGARLEGVRSSRTTLPDGRELELYKFASMGNATTFPVQTIVFWSLCVSVLEALGVRYDEARSSVWVYGDDIIVPSYACSDVQELLESVGLRVNTKKSFPDGPFRESCGMHAFDGLDVTPGYLRTWASNAPGMVSMCATANVLMDRGFVHAADVVFDHVEAALGDSLPFTRRPYGLTRVVGLAQGVATAADIIHLNESSGHHVLRNSYHDWCVRAWGLYEAPSKRKVNTFVDIGDMWAFVHTSCRSKHDRGIIPGQPKLTRRLVDVLR